MGSQSAISACLEILNCCLSVLCPRFGFFFSLHASKHSSNGTSQPSRRNPRKNECVKHAGHSFQSGRPFQVENIVKASGPNFSNGPFCLAKETYPLDPASIKFDTFRGEEISVYKRSCNCSNNSHTKPWYKSSIQAV